MAFQSSRGFHTRLLLSALPVVVALLSLAGLLTASRLAGWLNSDMLYLVTLFRDVVHHEHPLTGWKLAPAPYFFPDMALFFPILLVCRDVGHAFLAYTIVSFGCVIAAAVWIGSHVSSSTWRVRTCVLSAGLFLVLVFQGREYDLIAYSFLYPSFHGGTLLAGLLLVALHLSLLRKGPSLATVTGYYVVCTLSLASDILVIPQFVLPLLVATLLACLTGRLKLRYLATIFALVLISAVSASTILTAVGTTATDIAPLRPPLGWDRFAATVDRFEGDLSHFKENAALVGVIAFWAVLSVGVLRSHRHLLLKRRRRRGRLTRAETLVFFVAFSLLCYAGTLAGILVTGSWDGMSYVRYIMPAIIGPVLFAAITLSSVCRRRYRPLVTAMAVVLIVCAAVPIVGRLGTFSWSDWRQPYPGGVAQLDNLATRLDLRYGLSRYWPAKLLTVLSRRGLRVNQLCGDLEVYRWINNLYWYCGKPEGGDVRFPEYTFLIVDSEWTDAARLRFGEPAVKRNFSGMRVWVYNRKEDVAFRNFLRAPVLSKLGGLGLSGPSKPRVLAEYTANSVPWNSPSAVVIAPNGTLDVRFDPPVLGDVLELSLDSNDQYAIEVFRGAHRIATLSAPAMPECDGLQARYLLLPDSAGRRGIDRLRIKPVSGDGLYSVGHAYVYWDCYSGSHAPEPSVPLVIKLGNSLYKRSPRPEDSSG